MVFLALVGRALMQQTILVQAAVIFGLIGASSAAWFVFRNRVIGGREAEAKAVVHTAGEAGFEADAIDDLGPRLSSFDNEVEKLGEWLTRIRSDIQSLRKQDQEKQVRLSESEGDLRRLNAELTERLTRAGITSVEEYAAKLADREKAETDLKLAADPLRDYFQSGSESPSVDDFSSWERELSRLLERSEGGEPDTFDQARYDDVKKGVDLAEEGMRSLEDRLATHRQKLKEFNERAQQLPLSEFVDEPPQTFAESTRQLVALADNLEAIGNRIQLDADECREVVEIFEAIRREEESKVAQLFGEHDRASLLFSQLTRGRYTGVEYDPATHRITVTRDGKEPLLAHRLSHATYDQLYLSVRVSLGEQLLSGEPGFFIMDDAFLAADKYRLREGFATLQSLAKAGWSILYFTAKEEVGERLAPELGLPIVELQELP
jgi:uncharacterized protein YhaN